MGDLLLYIDGLPASGTYVTPDLEINIGSALPVRIGVNETADGSMNLYFNGSIDEVRLYDRALTQPEIQELATP